MKICLLALTAFLLATVSSWACDDHVGECEIEDWRSIDSGGGMLMIEGSTTCDSGSISIRLYDGAGDDQAFLGTANGYIEGHVLSAIAIDIGKPEMLSIKYSINPRN